MKNILIKPNKENLTKFVTIGGSLIFISFFDVLVNTFLNLNFTSFLPSKLSYFAPLIIGTIGLYLIRIEFSGNKFSSIEVISEKIEKKIDLFNRGEKYKKIKIDDTFPEYLINNLDKYKKYIV